MYVFIHIMLQLITTERNIRTLIVQNTIKKDIFSSYSSSFPTKSVCTLSFIFGLLLVLMKKVILSQKWIKVPLHVSVITTFIFSATSVRKTGTPYALRSNMPPFLVPIFQQHCYHNDKHRKIFGSNDTHVSTIKNINATNITAIIENTVFKIFTRCT